jgi:hypothetical protein
VNGMIALVLDKRKPLCVRLVGWDDIGTIVARMRRWYGRGPHRTRMSWELNGKSMSARDFVNMLLRVVTRAADQLERGGTAECVGDMRAWVAHYRPVNASSVLEVRSRSRSHSRSRSPSYATMDASFVRACLPSVAAMDDCPAPRGEDRVRPPRP